MQELRDRYIRFDWAIKRLLRQKANFGVLEGFLTVFLNEPINPRFSDKMPLSVRLESHGSRLRYNIHPKACPFGG